MKPLPAYWQDSNALSLALLPLSWLFCGVATTRAWAYRRGLLARHGLPVPVVVVGNVSVGGTGKTPLVIWLCQYLRERGARPGIVTRGYRGRARVWPQRVAADGDPDLVGDEPVLLARHAGCPVMAGPNRVASGRALVDLGCDLIVSDDGLQHYALHRDLEIAVVDAERRLGNRRCLPAGPLREPPSRLRRVDLVVVNGEAAAAELAVRLDGERAVNLRDPRLARPLESFADTTVAALAGIGNPRRFFRMLRDRGLRLREFPFADHHPFTAADLAGMGPEPVLMTEKDAVKCERFARDNWWFVPVEVRPDPALTDRLDLLLAGLRRHG